jgi:hypothetical protein
MLDASIFRDQMTVRRLRLGAGLIMLCYLALHFCMHALGNVSFEAMQWGTQIHDFVWHSVPGTLALYGALATHFTLALYALYSRRSFRVGAGELIRLLLGFSSLPLLFHHFAAERYVYSAFDVTRRYDVTLTSFLFRSVLRMAASRCAPGRLDAWVSRRALLATCTIQLSQICSRIARLGHTPASARFARDLAGHAPCARATRSYCR